MKSRVLGGGVAMLFLVLVGCQKKEAAKSAANAAGAEKPLAVEVVKPAERSKSFEAVNRQLELGGTLYGYMDVDGDVEKLAGALRELLGEAAKADPKAASFARHDYAELARILGLTDVKALGISSVPDGTGFFRNRIFLHTGGGERHGLMAALGGRPGPFKHVNLAPADAAFYAESELDAGVVYRTFKDVFAKVAGEPASNQLETALRRAGEAATISFLDLIHGLKGHSALVLRLDSERTMRLPGRNPVVVPAFSLLACVEGIAPMLEGSLEKSGAFKRTDQGTLHIYELAQRTPIEGLQPVFVADGSTLFLATSLAFFNECREQKASLAQAPEFQRALAQVGREGNGLTYVSPRLFAELRKLDTLNPNLPAQAKSVLGFALRQLPSGDTPLVAIRTHLDDGILVRSYWHRSLKQEVAAATFYNPLTLGAFAAMAVPAFQKTRTASQEKAVMNNLRMLAAAADQHYLETGTTTATYDQLVGPGRYVKVLQPVAGENYRAIRFVQGQPLRVRLASGKVIEYKP